MKIYRSKTFKKMYKKLPRNIQQKVDIASLNFYNNPKSPSLKVHELSGKMKNIFSFSAGYDIRIIFEKKGNYIENPFFKSWYTFCGLFMSICKITYNFPSFSSIYKTSPLVIPPFG